jgi:3-dehydro-L-gulonate 2-dehydrogenase
LKLFFDDLKNLFEKKLIKYKFSDKDAEVLSEIFTDNTFSGVESHGINRFPDFIQAVKNSNIEVNAKPSIVNSFGAFERWDGNFGAGPLNALRMTERAIELAKQHGIGCVALKNSNHWMRPGYFGWHAADQGFILICWTNTIPNLPPWKSSEPKTGNNPFVIALPRKQGNIVLDMAMSQFSYGKMLNYQREGKNLPMHGGFDKKGNLTVDPGEIINSERPLPIGYWKGSSLSLMLDLVATILAGGKATKDLSKSDSEKGPSQIFIVINPKLFSNESENEKLISDILSFFKSAKPINGETKIQYPGERALTAKRKNIDEGVEIDENVLTKVKEL